MYLFIQLLLCFLFVAVFCSLNGCFRLFVAIFVSLWLFQYLCGCFGLFFSCYLPFVNVLSFGGCFPISTWPFKSPCPFLFLLHVLHFYLGVCVPCCFPSGLFSVSLRLFLSLVADFGLVVVFWVSLWLCFISLLCLFGLPDCVTLWLFCFLGMFSYFCL